MKKLTALLLTVLLLLSCCVTAFARFDEEENFGIAKGYVRTKEVFQSAGGETYKTTRSYNEQGNLLKQKEVYQAGNYSSTTTQTFVYDKRGFVIKETDVTKNSNGETEKAVYLYTNDKKGHSIREEVQMGEASHIFKRTYDKKGNLTKEINYFNNGIDKATWTYDAAGNLLKHTSRTDYENNTWEKSSLVYTYDKNGNQVKEKYVMQGSDGSSEKRTVSDVYNAKGQLIKSTDNYFFDNNAGYQSTSRRVTDYTYGKNGKLAKETEKAVYDNDPPEKTTITYTYDGKGRITKMVTEKSTVGKSVLTYTYDKKGRPVKVVDVQTNTDGVCRLADAFSYDKAGNLLKHICTSEYSDGLTTRAVYTYAYQKIAK